MHDTIGENNNIDSENRERIRQLARALLANGVVYHSLEFDDDLATCLIFVNTKNLSAVDIHPLEKAAQESDAELEAVIDSSYDELCFFVTFKQQQGSNSVEK